MIFDPLPRGGEGVTRQVCLLISLQKGQECSPYSMWQDPLLPKRHDLRVSPVQREQGHSSSESSSTLGEGFMLTVSPQAVLRSGRGGPIVQGGLPGGPFLSPPSALAPLCSRR